MWDRLAFFFEWNSIFFIRIVSKRKLKVRENINFSNSNCHRARRYFVLCSAFNVVHDYTDGEECEKVSEKCVWSKVEGGKSTSRRMSLTSRREIQFGPSGNAWLTTVNFISIRWGDKIKMAAAASLLSSRPLSSATAQNLPRILCKLGLY